jgi:CDP-diacylglycerol--glycerol-3-phosphate 3-phosphatidyltransferase
MEQAQQLYITDRILAKSLLRLIPRTVTPNQITIIRFIATPLVVGLLIGRYYQLGFSLFVLLALSDAVDGAMARTRDQITDWGKVYDPVADKLLVGSVMVVLMVRHLNIQLVAATLGLELFIIIMGLFKKRQGKIIQANWWGKSKMILQCVGLGCLLLGIIFHVGWGIFMATLILLGALILGIISLFTYGL